MIADDPKLTAYARRLSWALSALPAADRDSIVAEVRSHVLDRVEAGASVEDALAALGPPETYAREFHDAYTVARAIATRRTPFLFSALLHGAARSVVTAGVGLVLILLWLFTALIAYTAVLKISDPAHVGLWRGQHFFFIGIIDDPSTGRELLGAWLMPLAILCIVIAWLITRALAVWALRRLAPRS